MFIGDLRRSLFINVEDEWNGVVRDITARCETTGMECDPVMVFAEIQEFYRNRARLVLLQLELQKTIH